MKLPDTILPAGRPVCSPPQAQHTGIARQNRGNILLFQTAVLREEFIAVAVERQMAGRNHDGRIKAIALCHRGHEHCRGRGHAEIGDLNAFSSQRLHKPCAELRAGQAGIPAHGHTQRVCSQPLPQPQGKAPANVAAGLLGEVYVLALNALHRDAADIAAVL